MLDNTDVLAVKTGMLYDETIIRIVASALKNHSRENTLRLVCDPEYESTSEEASFALGLLIDELLPLATLITPNKSEAEHILSRNGRKVTISSLADMISASKELLTLGKKAVLLKGGRVTTTMTEVHELLGQNPQISVCKYGLLEENMNILQVGLSEEDRISHLVVDVLQEPSVSGGDIQTSIFIRPRIKFMGTRGMGCTLGAAITCGLANELTSNLPLLFTLPVTNYGLFSSGGSSQWNDVHPPGNSQCFLCRDRSLFIEPRPLTGFEICAEVALLAFRIPNALNGSLDPAQATSSL